MRLSARDGMHNADKLRSIVRASATGTHETFEIEARLS